MSTDKKSYFLRLNPPRASFTSDMTDDERAIMLKHVAYWKQYIEDGTCVVLGPVADPKGTYGIAVVQVESEAQLNIMIKNDPANGLNIYEIYPMRAVIKEA
jgi:uncharacterized protein